MKQVIFLYKSAEVLDLVIMEVVVEFLNQTTAYLDSLDWVERYAWFAYMVSYMIGLHSECPWPTRFQSSSVHNQMNIIVGYSLKIPRLSLIFKIKDLLQDDGGLNQLGELYTGATTIHTEVITASGYQTFDGADTPMQTPVTSWPVLAVSASQQVAIGFKWVFICVMMLFGLLH